MMNGSGDDAVKQQDDVYPHPARDPANEMDELMISSPSHPLEIDHFIFGGKRDWSQPTRILGGRRRDG